MPCEQNANVRAIKNKCLFRKQQFKIKSYSVTTFGKITMEASLTSTCTVCVSVHACAHTSVPKFQVEISEDWINQEFALV